MNEKKPRYLLKEIIFSICAFLALTLPLVILVIVQKDTYFKTETKSSVSVALVLALIVFVLQLKDYTKHWNALVWLIVLAVIIHFLRPILGDLEMILWMAALGQALFKPFKALANYYKELRKAHRNAKINAKAQYGNFNEITEAIKNIGTGR